MPYIEARFKAGARHPHDLVLTVQDRTFNYLMTSPAREIRISAYLDQDLDEVLPMYAEVFVGEECRFVSKILRMSPGSRTREVALPGPMKEGEQLTIVVTRTSLDAIE